MEVTFTWSSAVRNLTAPNIAKIVLKSSLNCSVSVGYTGIGSIELAHPLVRIQYPFLNLTNDMVLYRYQHQPYYPSKCPPFSFHADKLVLTPSSHFILSSLLAIHSVCASHLILSVQSLASYMGSDPVFLLSNIEMARVHWRHGSNANELVVDVDNEADAEASEAQQAMELQHLDYGPQKRIILPRTVVQTLRENGSIPSSRVGILEDTSQTSRANSRLSFSSYAFQNT